MFKSLLLIITLVTASFSVHTFDSIVAGSYVIVKKYNDSFMIQEHIYKDGTLIRIVEYDPTNGIKDTTKVLTGD